MAPAPNPGFLIVKPQETASDSSSSLGACRVEGPKGVPSSQLHPWTLQACGKHANRWQLALPPPLK